MEAGFYQIQSQISASPSKSSPTDICSANIESDSDTDHLQANDTKSFTKSA